MNEKDKFFENIRRSLGRDSVQVSEVENRERELGLSNVSMENEARVAYLDAQNRSLELMAQLFESASMSGWNVIQSKSLSDAAGHIARIVREMDAKLLVSSNHEVIIDMKLSEYLEQIPVYTVPISIDNSSEELIGKEIRIQCEKADIGITGVDFAIAETGSCVLVVRPGVGRLESLLPPVHIAVVRSGQVLSSLDELFAIRRMKHLMGDGEGYMSIITGPSRTADIQQKLITGVHGPIHVHMILVQ
tara:strand:- start:9703 stop:10443 length:741 start_codon:yes stop_codon:yes gene_type:complete